MTQIKGISLEAQPELLAEQVVNTQPSAGDDPIPHPRRISNENQPEKIKLPKEDPDVMLRSNITVGTGAAAGMQAIHGPSDPLSAAASIATIIAMIGNSATTMNSIRTQCQDKDVELRLELPIGRLKTIRAALHQVKLLVTERVVLKSQHQQLVVDLDTTLIHCKLLVQQIDDSLSKLVPQKYSSNKDDNWALFLEDRNIDEYLTRLDRQLCPELNNYCVQMVSWPPQPRSIC